MVKVIIIVAYFLGLLALSRHIPTWWGKVILAVIGGIVLVILAFAYACLVVSGRDEDVSKRL